jgi:hypothetical protein
VQQVALGSVEHVRSAALRRRPDGALRGGRSAALPRLPRTSGAGISSWLSPPTSWAQILEAEAERQRSSCAMRLSTPVLCALLKAYAASEGLRML